MKKINLLGMVSAALGGAAMATLFTLQIPNSDASQTVDDALIKELKVFTDVLSLVQENYVQEVSSKDLTSGAIRGIMSALDPHSAYLDSAYFEDLQAQTKGEFGGLGIEIAMRDGVLVVVAPMEGTPAERAGVKSGDIIVKIDGEYLRDVSLVDIVKKLRGPHGSPVVISVMRKGSNGDLKDIRVIRERIQIHSVKSTYLGEGFGYIKVRQFMESTADDLEKGLRSFEKEAGSIRGLILDFRNNPGGLLTQAIKVSDFFLKDGVIVYTKGRAKAQEQHFYAHAAETEPDYPIVVIINGGSASASEIVAGSLKDHGRALVIGQQSFGKGSVQTINPLNNGGAVQLTTALYYTKSGRSIQALGVVPDIVLGPEVEDPSDAEKTPIQGVREADLPGAFKNPLSKKDAKRGAKADKLPKSVVKVPLDHELLEKDLYIRRAFELLKTFNIFSKKTDV